VFRLLFWGIVFYFGFKWLSRWLNPPSEPKTTVKGAPSRNAPLDLSQQDVEEADFEDIPD